MSNFRALHESIYSYLRIMIHGEQQVTFRFPCCAREDFNFYIRRSCKVLSAHKGHARALEWKYAYEICI